MFRGRRGIVVMAALSAVLALGAVPALVGCSDASSNPGAAVEGAGTQGKRFTVPSAYFASMDAKTAEKRLQELGATDVQRNDDGSYTVTMDDAHYEAFVDDNAENTRRTIDSIPGSTTCPSISKVKMNEDFSEIQFQCTKDDIGTQAEDASNLAIYVSCLQQAIAGDQLQCKVSFVAPDGHIIETRSYPEN